MRPLHNLTYKICLFGICGAAVLSVRFQRTSMYCSIFYTELSVSAENAVFGRVRFGDERIVGGKTAQPNQYPFMVHLVVKFEVTDEICGGSLINSQFILSAAHCIKKKTGEVAKSIKAVLGVHDIYDETETSVVKKDVEKWFFNNYDHTVFVNDIAILQLPESVELNAAVQPICIPPAGHAYAEGTVTALGWGATNDVTFDIGEQLQEADLSVIPDSNCKDDNPNFFKPDIMMCAGHPDGTQDTCSGDSGGPIFINDDKGQPTVIGLTSFAKKGCGKPGQYAFYTKVSSFTDWIVGKVALGGPVCIATFRKSK